MTGSGEPSAPKTFTSRVSAVGQVSSVRALLFPPEGSAISIQPFMVFVAASRVLSQRSKLVDMVSAHMEMYAFFAGS